MPKCLVCNAKFATAKYNTTTKKYCSRRCKQDVCNKIRRDKYVKKDDIVKICEHCGSKFDIDSKHSFTKYCSKKCRDKIECKRVKTKKALKRDKTIKICKCCKEQFKPNKLTPFQKYCNNECRMFDTREHKLGIIKEWRGRNKHKSAEYYYKDHEQSLKWQRASYLRHKDIPMFKLNHAISNGTRRSLRGNKFGRHWESLVGYTVDDLEKHLEPLFTVGMTWENYGDWHIDHIIPIALWQYSSYEDREFKQCWSLANLQPLWAEENIKKGSKIAA